MKKEIIKIFNHRLTLQKPKLLSLSRFYSNENHKPAIRSNQEKYPLRKDEVEEDGKDEITPYSPRYYSPLERIKYWSEGAAIRAEKRAHRFPNTINGITDFLKFVQSLNDFPLTFGQLVQYMKKKHEKNQLIEQKYLPRRVSALKSDLAAAHFLVRRGGSIKFVGNPEWVGIKEKNITLPISYVPGMFVECIKAENTELYLEGLENLKNLPYLTYLSLKNLETVNDWFLDQISEEHHMNLKHLDISGCKNVTYRGLSCFYRFEKLEVLEVEGVPDTTEFKLGCLMLLEIKPFLDIRGIDLTVPEEIKPTISEEKVSTET